MDTQWPRWEVFKQDTPNKPHQAVGSVHAADPEHALFTARNIFARRPQAVSMWVVPASVISSWTQEELAEGRAQSAEGLALGSSLDALCSFAIFRKTSHKRSMTFMDYAGTLEATSALDALQQALIQFTSVPALAWWVVPEASIVRSEPNAETIESWFEPAKDKTYMQQQYYATIGSHISKHKAPNLNKHSVAEDSHDQ